MLRTKGRRKRPTENKNFYRINSQIRADNVIVIDDIGGNLGAMPTFKAIQLAEEKDLDLVEVFPKADTPVCKITDYGQFQYQQKRKEQETKANIKKVEIKGVRISFKIGKHDWDMRISQADKFISKGDKVKIEMILRGREKQYSYDAQDKVNEFIKQLQQNCPLTVETPVKRQGGQIFALIAPKK